MLSPDQLRYVATGWEEKLPGKALVPDDSYTIVA
jgi:hypothetical protein